MGKLRSDRVEELRSATHEDFMAVPLVRVLDIGAGRDVLKNRLAGLNELADCYERLIASGKYIGLESSADSNPRLVGHAHGFPFGVVTMDGVIMASVLGHLCDPIRALDQVWRVLKPGAVFLSTEMNLTPE